MDKAIRDIAVAQIVECTEAEGPGRRFAVWFQGCPLRCPGCCNPEMLPFRPDQTTLLDEVIAQMQAARAQHAIEGITLLGGEPIAHAAAAATLARVAWHAGLSVMVFTGFLLEELRQRNGPELASLLAHTDILVDGPYLREQPDSSRRWIGSTNQRIHFLTDCYSVDDPCWREPNTLEIRLRGSELTLNGFPTGWSRQPGVFAKRRQGGA
jgi:anaerobic ribonucleoside-triphosphate reductase activating protein